MTSTLHTIPTCLCLFWLVVYGSSAYPSASTASMDADSTEFVLVGGELEHHREVRKNEQKIIDLEQGWKLVQKGITKLQNILEKHSESQFSSEEYMTLYSTIYIMCTQEPPHNYSQQLYEKYRESIEEYITSTVLPSLKEKKDEILLKEVVKRWLNHKIMVYWLLRFFHYLDRYFLPKNKLPSTEDTGLILFYDLVYQEMNAQVRDAVISMINQEREGEEIDQGLLKNVLDIYVEMGRGSMKHYGEDFEAAMLKDTAAYYSQKASTWIMVDSSEDYVSKVSGCLEQEKDRASSYLHSSSRKKLLEIVDHELLSVYRSKTVRKAQPNNECLLTDDPKNIGI